MYVNAAASVSPYLGTVSNPLRMIQQGLTLVEGGGTVHIAGGTYLEHPYLDAERGWEYLGNLTVAGETGTTIDGGGSGVGFFVKAIDNISLENLLIQNCETGIQFTDDAHGEVFSAVR